MEIIEIAGPTVRVGDDLVDWGKRIHRVERIEPYEGPLVDNGTFPPSSRKAFCEDGYMTTLHGETSYLVVQREYHNPTYGWHLDELA